jgi:CHAT domain-containing protein
LQEGTVQQKLQAVGQTIDDFSALAHLAQITGRLIATLGEGDLLEQAILQLNAALQIHRALPRNRVFLKETAIDYYFLGYTYSRLEQYDEALSAFQQAEAIARRFNSPETWRILYRMGSVREKQERPQEAITLYTQAAEVFETMSLHQRLEEVKVPLREGVFEVYQNLVRLLFKFHAKKPEQHYVEQAFLYHEKGKARTFLDLLEEAKVRVREGIDPALPREEEKIVARISGIHRTLAKPELSKEQEKQLLATLAEQEQTWQALQVKIAVANPKYAELTSPQVAGIQQAQAILDKETLLLEYALGEEKSFLWGVTQNSMQAHELPTQNDITQLVEQYLPTLREPLYGRDEIERHIALGRQLYRILIEPAVDQLRGKSKLIIVPDGSLYYLPLEALIADDGGNSSEKGKNQLQSLPYLAKNYTVTYIPSASVLVTLEKDHNTNRHKGASSQAPLLAFGDPVYQVAPEPLTVALDLRRSYEKRGGGFPRLEYSAEEVEKIAGVYGITLPSDAVNLREKATEKRLREMDLTRYRMLHFATHAILSDEVKWITQPALVLSLTGTDDTHDGFLQMGEIFNLRLDADLVVLSACDTGRGKLYRGEGVVGLTRAFIYAGTPSVVASLWKVYDKSTSLFMEFFYRNLKEGLSKTEALRQAKRQMIQTRADILGSGEEQSLAAPYFWAPFILIGSEN